MNRAEQPLVRVVRGALADEEPAALTAVLLSRAGAAGEPQAAQEAPRPAATWRRLERAGGYRAPHSWQG